LDLVLVARVRVNHVPLAVLVGGAVAVRHAHLIDHWCLDPPAALESEQEAKQLLKHEVDPAEEQADDDRKGDDHRGEIDGLPLVGPGDLAQLGTNVTYEVERIAATAPTPTGAGQRHRRPGRTPRGSHCRSAATASRGDRRAPTGLLASDPTASGIGLGA